MLRCSTLASSEHHGAVCILVCPCLGVIHNIFSLIVRANNGVNLFKIAFSRRVVPLDLGQTIFLGQMHVLSLNYIQMPPVLQIFFDANIL